MLYLYHVNMFSYQELHSLVTIGRTTGDLVFGEDGRMSGKHAQISVELQENATHVFIEDLGSKNRTVVNRVEIPANQKIRIKNFALLEVGSQQFILTDSKSLSIQQLNEVMEHHMTKAVVKLEITDKTKTGVRSPERSVTIENPLAAKESLLLQLQKELVNLETVAKAELAKLDEQKEKIITAAKTKKSELMTKANAIKAELAEAQKLRAEMEQKKKKIINLKDLPADADSDEISTEELPE